MLFNNVIFYLTGKYRIKMNTYNCRLDNAQCEKIDNNCICHCYPEFMTVNGPCLKGKICGKIKHELYIEDRIIVDIICDGNFFVYLKLPYT